MLVMFCGEIKEKAESPRLHFFQESVYSAEDGGEWEEGTWYMSLEVIWGCWKVGEPPHGVSSMTFFLQR